jgi:hypothetical protein
MKLFDRMVDRINFKRLLAVYMIVAVLISIVMGAIVYRVFNDKLTFARNYIKVSDKIRQSDGSNWESIQKDLLWLAYESPDIVDILILNDENEIMFSAKGANIQRGSSTFILKKDTDRTNQKYLTIESAPNVYFKLLRLAYLPIIADILEKEQDIRSEKRCICFPMWWREPWATRYILSAM